MDKAEKVYNSLIKEGGVESFLPAAGYVGSAVLGHQAKKKDKSHLGAAAGVGATGATASSLLGLKKSKKALEQQLGLLASKKQIRNMVRAIPPTAALGGAALGAASYGLGRAFTSKND